MGHKARLTHPLTKKSKVRAPTLAWWGVAPAHTPATRQGSNIGRLGGGAGGGPGCSDSQAAVERQDPPACRGMVNLRLEHHAVDPLQIIQISKLDHQFSLTFAQSHIDFGVEVIAQQAL